MLTHQYSLNQKSHRNLVTFYWHLNRSL